MLLTNYLKVPKLLTNIYAIHSIYEELVIRLIEYLYQIYYFV